MPVEVKRGHLPDLSIVRLERDHAPEAAKLCAGALRRARRLDARLPAAGNAARSLATAWARRLADQNFAGFGAVVDGRLVGTLGASYRRLPEGSNEVVWSARVGGWMPLALAAVADGWPVADVLAPLYRAVADWLREQQVPLHFASAFSADQETIRAWRDLGFRPQGILALLDSEAVTALQARRPPAGVCLRVATPDDAHAVTALLIESHRIHAALPGSFYVAEDGERFYPDLVANELRYEQDEVHYLVAEEGRRIIGFASSTIREAMPGDLARYTEPLPLGYVDEVCVTAAARGRGIAAALLAGLFPWFNAHNARDFGLHYIANNTAASATWRRLGFRALEMRLQGGPDPLRLALPEEVAL